MPKSTLIVFFALCIVHQVSSSAISYGDDCESSKIAASPGFMVKPQLQDYSPGSLPSLGGKFIEVAVITGPSGSSPDFPVSSASFPTTTTAVGAGVIPVTTSMGSDPKDSTTDIRVEVIVDDAHELFFNGNGQGWRQSGPRKKDVYNFQGVKTGDVIGIQGKDKKGYAGILVQINYLTGPYAGQKHVTKSKWICSRHKPKDDTWMKNGFTNTGKYDLRHRFVDAVGHGDRDHFPWFGRGDAHDFDPAAEWFWVAHNFIVDHAWCRFEFNFSQDQDDTQGQKQPPTPEKASDEDDDD